MGGGGGGRQGMGWGFDFFEKFAVKFPAHGQIIPVKCNQISPPWATNALLSNKTLQSLFINVVASPKIHDPVKAAVIPLNHSIHVKLRRIEKPLGENPHFVSLNTPFFVKGTKKSIFQGSTEQKYVKTNEI